MKKYKSRLTDEVFNTLKGIEEHLDLIQVEGNYELYYDIIEDNTIDDTPEPSEILDESSAITEEEMKLRAKAVEVVDQYMNAELTDTSEKELIAHLLRMTQDKSVNKDTHRKGFRPDSTTRTAFRDYYTRLLRDFQDPSRVSCPACDVLWSTIAQDLGENLSFGDQHKGLQGGFPKVKIQHIKAKHPSVWKLVQDLFGKGADEMPDDRPSTVPNPEQLSKEELAQEINSNEELRHQFFREWLKKLKNRE